MANTGSSSGGRFRRRCGGVKRVDVVTVFVAAVLCSASYCLGIWHNSRGAADSRVLGPSAVVIVAPESCGGDEPLEFEARHSAEAAGLSVSSSSTTTSTRRALRGVAPGGTGRGGEFVTVWTARGRFAEALDGGALRFMDAGAVRA